MVGGQVVQGENFQALNLLTPCLAPNVNCVYIDPPYNAAETQILYKNEYRHSSWLALMRDRLALTRTLMQDDGVLCVTIDDYEIHWLRGLLEAVFPISSHLATAAIRNNPSGRATVKGFAVNHEYALFIANSPAHVKVGRMPHSEKQLERYDEQDNIGRQYEWENLRKSSRGSRRQDRPKQYYPIYWNRDSQELRIPDLRWNEASRSWEVLDPPTSEEEVVWPKDEAGRERVWGWGVSRHRGLTHYRHPILTHPGAVK